jgi:mono/diheme cytochrome c family protein
MKKVIILPLLLVLIGYGAYRALILVDTDFKYGRMWETPGVHPHEEAPIAVEEGLVPFEGGEALLRASSAEALASPLQKNDRDILKQGEVLYFTYCAQCHGKHHDGNGTVGQSFQPLPSDLRSARVQSLTEGMLFREISYGVPGGRQPPLAGTIDVLDRWYIIVYLQSLGPRR